MNKKNILLSLFILPACIVLNAQRVSDKSGMEAERASIQRELQQIQASYDAVKGLSKENLSRLASLNRKIELQEKYLSNIGKEIRLLDDDIYYSSLEINRLKKQLDTLKSHYAKTIVYTYKNRSNYDYLNFIFSSKNFNDAVRRISYLRSYRNYREKQLANVSNTRALITKRYQQQLAAKNRKSQALHTRENEFMVLEMQKREKDSLAKTLALQSGDLQKQIALKKLRDQQLRNNIMIVIRQEVAEAKKLALEDAKKERIRYTEDQLQNALAGVKPKEITVEVNNKKPKPEPDRSISIPQTNRLNPTLSTSTAIRPVPVHENNPIPTTAKTVILPIAGATTPTSSTPAASGPEGGYLNYRNADITLNSDFSQNKGKLPHPVDNGIITLGFGRYKIEGIGPDIVGDNPGITYSAPLGAPVKAVFDGEVANVSKIGGMAFVVLRHGKYFTAYSNLATVNISKGSKIARGQVIGTVGADESTGNGKLDFLLMIEQKNVDPRIWLR